MMVNIPPPVMRSFIGHLLDNVKSNDSAATLRVIGETMGENGHQMVLTEASLLQGLMERAPEWFSEAEGMDGFRFMAQASAAMANLAVATNDAAMMGQIRKLFAMWKSDLASSDDPYAKGFVKKLADQETRILNARATKWFLVSDRL